MQAASGLVAGSILAWKSLVYSYVARMIKQKSDSLRFLRLGPLGSERHIGFQNFQLFRKNQNFPFG